MSDQPAGEGRNDVTDVMGSDEGHALVFCSPARVLTLQRSPEDAARLQSLIAERALDSGAFDGRQPFLFPAEISSNRLDAYFTRMAPSSLRNYAQDAAAGVSLQNSHRVDALGFGRSLTGVYEEQGDGLSRVTADFYTVPGLRLNEVSTDDFILGLRTGILHDVSIGFYGGQFRCSICGGNLLSWDCPHWPGMEYEARDESGNVTGKVIAFAWVDDARLAEVSIVYDGATPGAGVLKAQRAAEEGRLQPKLARLLEARYRIRLPGMQPSFGGVTVPATREVKTVDEPVVNGTPAGGGGEPAPDPGMLTGLDAQRVIALNARLTELGAPELDIEARLQWLITRAEAADQAANELTTVRQALANSMAEADGLRSFADDGRAYRADLVGEALAEGVRAMGAGFAQETYRGILDAAPLATIKRMRDDWKAVGDARFPGGRVTVDTDERARAARPKEPETPNAAFRGA